MEKKIMSPEKQIEQRDKVLKMRNFHYENFNKWSSFFYIIIGALFVGYYNIVGRDNSELFQNVILLLGYIVSLCWHISNKGYYYWEMHWIFFIIDIEQKLNSEDDKIYSMFYCKEDGKNQCGDSNGKEKVKGDNLYNGNYWIPWEPANVSTSKVTLVLSFIVACSWSFLLIYKSCKNNGIETIWIAFIAVIATLILTAIAGAILHSTINHKIKYFTPIDSFDCKWYKILVGCGCKNANKSILIQNQKKYNSMKKIYLWLLGFLFLLAPVGIYIIKFSNLKISDMPSDWGIFGDYMGGVYSVIVVILGAILTYYCMYKDRRRKNVEYAIKEIYSKIKQLDKYYSDESAASFQVLISEQELFLPKNLFENLKRLSDKYVSSQNGIVDEPLKEEVLNELKDLYNEF
ncbi:MAG: hypothetical protein MJ237_09010 [bacterium]|nr:hypothetical protein [bacterium]